MAYHTIWRHKRDSSFVIWLDIVDDEIDVPMEDSGFIDALEDFLDNLQRDCPEITLPNHSHFERVATKFYIP